MHHAYVCQCYQVDLDGQVEAWTDRTLLAIELTWAMGKFVRGRSSWKEGQTVSRSVKPGSPGPDFDRLSPLSKLPHCHVDRMEELRVLEDSMTEDCAVQHFSADHAPDTP